MQGPSIIAVIVFAPLLVPTLPLVLALFKVRVLARFMCRAVRMQALKYAEEVTTGE